MASSSMSTRRCSLVHPDGPAAAPRRALRKLASRRSLQTWAGGTDGGSRPGSRGTCAADGRRAGSRSAWSISGVAGASRGAVRAFAAAEISPRCASAEARSAPRRMSASEPASGGARFGSRAGRTCWAAFALSRSSCVHWPSQNKRSRRLISSGGTWVVPGARNNSMRGARRKSFHPSHSRSVPSPSRIASSDTRIAFRKSPRS